ncbi:hypothetical protein [Rhodococcus sp. OK302]|uniref:hypothetical protein n=1 Tax=Rhodococcus sp. OK302 TaxID=1882769 RepID=UPI0020CF6A1B|nr:hypothetical protein [Rhodococcus sp. OK302]
MNEPAMCRAGSRMTVGLTTRPGTMPADIRTEYLRASAAAVDSVVADYRASAGIDLDHELGSGACSSKGRLG